jgi:hypothetical protein
MLPLIMTDADGPGWHWQKKKQPLSMPFYSGMSLIFCVQSLFNSALLGLHIKSYGWFIKSVTTLTIIGIYIRYEVQVILTSATKET